MDVNIENIMKEIREKIAENGLNEEKENSFSNEEFVRFVGEMNNSWNIPEQVEITGKGKGIKKAFGKMLNFALLPRIRRQNEMNKSVTRAFNQLTAYIDYQNATIAKLNKRIEKLEKELKESK